MRTPPLFGVHGHSGSGKTTLIEQLVPLLRAHGLRVGTIKHVTHTPSLDTPGKDSHRHAAAGATCAAVVGAGTAAFFVHADEPDDLHTWARLFAGRVDLVLVEGYARMPMPAVALTVSDDDAILTPVEARGRHPAWTLRRPRLAAWPHLFPERTVHELAAAVLAAVFPSGLNDGLPAPATGSSDIRCSPVLHPAVTLTSGTMRTRH
jgi:molybdopterin-guanine dinucleotide biosynthesis protein MobB